MKIVIPGGTGQVGLILQRALTEAGHRVAVLSRRAGAALEPGVHGVRWDGSSQGPWVREIDGCAAVINLAGRSVSCRYTKDNLRAMMDSRVDSTAAIGKAIANAAEPPAVWLQMSTATIYAHRFDAANDEATGVLGGGEPGVPDYWDYSVRIAQAWEDTQAEAATPGTRKVAMRTAMVMSPDRGGVFDYLYWLARLGLGGPVAGGRQYVSWIHDRDLVRAVEFLLERGDISGPINLASPGPLPQRRFMRELRARMGIPVGLPATRWMTEIGAFALRSDTELLLKSRRVVPGRLHAAGFDFNFPDWPAAADDLVRRRKTS